MKNAILIIIVLGILAWYFLYFRNKKTRPEMIDYLNIQVGNKDGIWTKMTDDELKAAYEFTRLYQLNGESLKDKIDPELKAKISVLSAKYNIFT